MKLDTPIVHLKGIGNKTEQILQSAGVYTIGDILLRFPKNYTTMPEVALLAETTEDHFAAVQVTLLQTPALKKGRRGQIVDVLAADESGKVRLRWFYMPYIKNQISKGNRYVFYGKIKSLTAGGETLYQMDQPVIYSVEQYQERTSAILPVYEKMDGISNQMLQKYIRQSLDNLSLTEEHIPLTIKKRRELADYNFAIRQIHFPDTMDQLIEARKRLVYEEFFLFLYVIRMQKEKSGRILNGCRMVEVPLVRKILEQLPYQLTNAQKKCLDEVMNDLSGTYSMQRLVQGDVGSGKTIIAFLSMIAASENGYQSALMAPTEVLAAQHFETFTDMLKKFTIEKTLIFLSGSMTVKQKREAYQKMKEHPDALIIGTQALIQEKAEFLNLGLVITDEQHRFGVRQREVFSKKGEIPHILVMSATPIPRTLAIILYGDLDISVIDELPAQRLPNKNCVVNTQYRQTAYEFIRKEVMNGHQAYVICPLVEESENMEAEDVAGYAERLSEYFRDSVKVGKLDGKMKPADKAKVMEAFSKGEIQVLVSTTVVEVGVNVPNATVMMIENAERFGLAQLHQLRGRVGRGAAQSYCIMVNTSDGKNAKKRLDILNHTNDGFKIASEDLRLRGPGDFFGIRQSGDLGFQLADIYQDASILKLAAEDVGELMETDPKLLLPEHENTALYFRRHSAVLIDKMNL